MLLFAAPGVFLVAAVLFVLLSRPRSNNLRLSSWPSVPSLYAQALLSMLTKGKTKPGGKHQQGQLIKVQWHTLRQTATSANCSLMRA